MKTIDDFLEAFRSDAELSGIVSENKILCEDCKPRNRRRKGFGSKGERVGAPMHRFWDSLDGAKLRWLFETKYSVNIGNTRLGAAMQTALILYLSEVVGK